MSVQQAMLCGDEIKSAVVDLGSSLCRFGTAGQDQPRHVFSSYLGSITEESKSRTIIGDSGLRYVHKDMSVRGPGAIPDLKWKDVEELVTYGVKDCMRLDLADTPLFIADNALLEGPYSSGSQSTENKKKVLETLFESAGTPALYLASSAMVSAFSMGRINSLVIDMGSSSTRITPIVDGYELKKSRIYTSRGGNLMDSMLMDEVQRRTGTYIHPWFECNRGAAVVRKTVDVTPSFREYHARQVVQDVKQWMCFVPHNPIVVPAEISDIGTISRLREEELQRRLLHFPPPYELPDGTTVHSGESICTVPERVFFPFPGSQSTIGSAGSASASAASRKRTRDLLDTTFPEQSGVSSTSSDAPSNAYAADSLMGKLGARADQESLADLVYACVAHVDPDVRKELLGNIQIVGGGALVQGLSNRLNYELNNIVPTHMKVKLVTATAVERQHAAWIGGSILSICGSFQQLWLTRQEYDEMGASRAALRFDH